MAPKTTAPAGPKLRILCLAGFLQSSAILSARMGVLRKATKSFADMHFLEPPILVQPADSPALRSASAEQIAEAAAFAEANPAEAPRGWWLGSKEEDGGWDKYRQLDQLLEYVSKALEEQGPFDGVWGFSQGAGLASILCALLEASPSARPSQFRTSHPPFKFAVVAAGFEIQDPRLTPYFPPQREGGKLKTPSLHVVGRSDAMVLPERSVKLAGCFEDARVEFHDGGHFTPSKPLWRNFFKTWLEAWVPQPSDVPLTEEEEAAAAARTEDEPIELRAVTNAKERSAAAVAPEEAEGGLEGVARVEGEGDAASAGGKQT